MTGLVILVIALAAATAFGLWRRKTDGRMKSIGDALPVPVADDAPAADVHDAVHDEHGGDVLTAAAIGTSLGEVATLVQFSSAFCQPCRATRRVLDEVVQMVPGVTHIEIDAESNLELVRQLDIRRTPTVLVLDERGAIRKRASGAPRKVDVIAAIGELSR
jgi:thiol-disulfide isomerase/thioredoxin